jgi:hypothetical protein
LVACLERSEGSYAPSGMTADRGIVCKTEQRPATMRRHFVLAQIASAADRIAYGCRADVKDGKRFLTSIDYSYVASTVRPFDPVALSACRPRCVSPSSLALRVRLHRTKFRRSPRVGVDDNLREHVHVPFPEWERECQSCKVGQCY